MKMKMLVIAIMGLSMFTVGMAFYLLADRMSGQGHLLAPLPPISVAAYIFVLDLFERTDPGALRGVAVLKTLKEVLLQCLVGGVCFIVVTFLMLTVLIIWYSVTPGSG